MDRKVPKPDYLHILHPICVYHILPGNNIQVVLAYKPESEPAIALLCSIDCSAR